MRINGLEFLTIIILQTFFKLLIGTSAYYILKWACADMDIKTLIFLYIAVRIGWASKLKFSFRK